MLSKLKWILLVIAVLALCAGIYGLNGLNNKARIGVGYMVKIACSEVYVAGRNSDSVRADDFFGIDPLMEKVKLTFDDSEGRVTGSFYGLGKSVATHRSGVGCTVVAENGVSPVNIPKPNPVPHTYALEIDPIVQNRLLDLFDDSAVSHPIHTRGALVVKDGNIIAEHYAPGFDENTRQQSWSMAKSMTSAMVGALKDAGWIDFDKTPLISEWSELEDPRGEITLTHLLHMTSGLDTHEVYSDTGSDVVQMLFNSRDTGAFAANQSYESKPGTVFEYSSATTNLLSRLIRDTLGNDGDYHMFPRVTLFDPLGMSSAIMEVDPVGTFIGSSYVYTTPRDYARFGQLFLQNGKWGDVQLLSEDWVKFSLTPAPASQGTYGAHWWLNESGDRFPDLPRDVFYMGGNDGQYVVVIPSKNAVIVRTGILRAPAAFDTDLYPLIRAIYNVL